MRAFLDNPALIHDYDSIGGADGRKAVRDDDGRAMFHQPIKRVLHQPFAFRVESRRCFVEQEKRRIAQQGSGDGNALALAT